MDRFPTPTALAASSPADVLRAWQGMGYDRRAINLRRAAQVIRDEHGGHVPDDIEALQRLSGIGPYTARAIAAIALDALSGRSTRMSGGFSAARWIWKALRSSRLLPTRRSIEHVPASGPTR